MNNSILCMFVRGVMVRGRDGEREEVGREGEEEKGREGEGEKRGENLCVF